MMVRWAAFPRRVPQCLTSELVTFMLSEALRPLAVGALHLRHMLSSQVYISHRTPHFEGYSASRHTSTLVTRYAVLSSPARRNDFEYKGLRHRLYRLYLRGVISTRGFERIERSC
ncbi:hypothetical protein FKP32DRAFT_1586798, partial [Trametes sanguinea]